MSVKEDIKSKSVKEDIKSMSVKRKYENKDIYKEINKLVILGIIKKWLSEVYSLEMAIHRKNSDISKVVADFRHLQTRLPHLNMIFTL